MLHNDGLDNVNNMASPDTGWGLKNTSLGKVRALGIFFHPSADNSQSLILNDLYTKIHALTLKFNKWTCELGFIGQKRIVMMYLLSTLRYSLYDLGFLPIIKFTKMQQSLDSLMKSPLNGSRKYLEVRDGGLGVPHLHTESICCLLHMWSRLCNVKSEHYSQLRELILSKLGHHPGLLPILGAHAWSHMISLFDAEGLFFWKKLLQGLKPFFITNQHEPHE